MNKKIKKKFEWQKAGWWSEYLVLLTDLITKGKLATVKRFEC